MESCALFYSYVSISCASHLVCALCSYWGVKLGAVILVLVAVLLLPMRSVPLIRDGMRLSLLPDAYCLLPIAYCSPSSSSSGLPSAALLLLLSCSCCFPLRAALPLFSLS